MCVSAWRKYASGSMPLSFAVPISAYPIRCRRLPHEQEIFPAQGRSAQSAFSGIDRYLCNAVIALQQQRLPLVECVIDSPVRVDRSRPRSQTRM